MVFRCLVILSFFIVVQSSLWYSTKSLLSKDWRYQTFKEWKIQNGKFYRTNEEEEMRFNTFLQNLKLIEELNNQHKGKSSFGLNKFADMSSIQFKTKILMPPQPPTKFSSTRYLELKHMKISDLPNSFDWRDKKGIVTSIKNQGWAGTCWAFSAIGNVESQWAILGSPALNLSVEQIVDCDANKDIPTEKADCGIYGGWPYLAYQYIQEVGGIERETDYPYCCGGMDNNPCFPCPPYGYNESLCGPSIPYCRENDSCPVKVNSTNFVKGLQVKDWKAINENETEIALHLMNVGPLSVAMNAEFLQFYMGDIFNPIFCNSDNLNHAVLLVGFGVEKGYFEDTPYWIVKNSWGEDWGKNGYFYIKRGSGTCGINTQVTTSILADLQ